MLLTVLQTKMNLFLFLNDFINGKVMFTRKSNLEFLIIIKTVYVTYSVSINIITNIYLFLLVA
jgi:hypothetical protein